MLAKADARPLHLGIHAWMLIVSLSAALPMLALLLAVTLWRLQDFAAQQQSRLQRQAQQAATALAHVVELRLVLLRTVAGGVAAREGLLQTLHEISARAAAEDPLIGSISLTDAQGRQWLNSQAPFGTPLPPTAVREGERPVFEQGRSVVSPLVTGAYSGERVVGLAVPVRDARGQVRYSLRATLRLGGLAQALAAADLPPEWVGAVVDQRMTVLARTQEAERFTGSVVSESLQAAIRAGGGGVVRALTLDGQRALIAIAAVGHTGWHLTLGAPESLVDRHERELLWQVMRFGAGVVVLGLLVSLLAGQQVARSVARATRHDVPPGPPTPVRELAQIRHHFQTVRDEARRAAAALEEARLDALTGLPGRAALLEAAAQRLAGLPGGESMALLFIDLDGFKAINDERGHDAGDRALQAVAGVLQAQLRGQDLPGRLGGDEFVVCLGARQDLAATIAGQVAARIVSEVGQLGNGLGCSIGLAISRPGEPLAALIERADAAMLQAKRSGRNRVQAAP